MTVFSMKEFSVIIKRHHVWRFNGEGCERFSFFIYFCEKTKDYDNLPNRGHHNASNQEA